MQSKESKTIKKVVTLLNKLEDHSTLHFTSIAKAIELHNKKISNIIFYYMPKKGLGDMAPAILLTQELELIATDGSKIQTCEHYIFYEDIKDNPLKTRFAIGHELGHILLHNPLKKSKNARTFPPVTGNDRIFAIRYTHQEEIEADLFAAIICEQRQVFPRKPKFKEPCIRILKEYAKKRYARPELKKFIKKVKTCIDCRT